MWSVEFPVSAAFAEAGFLLEAYFFAASIVRYIWQLLKFAKNSFPLISFPLVFVCARVLLLTTTYDVPDCKSAIVMPVMSGHSSVSQHHPALLFAQGQVH